MTMLEQTRSRMTDEEPPAQKAARGILDKDSGEHRWCCEDVAARMLHVARIFRIRTR